LARSACNVIINSLTGEKSMIMDFHGSLNITPHCPANTGHTVKNKNILAIFEETK
jgi:hypothetical protein